MPIVLFEPAGTTRGVYERYLASGGWPGAHAVRQESQLDDLLAGVRHEAPALVVASLADRGPHLIDLAAQVRAACARTRLLALVPRDDPTPPQRALGLGVLEILHKPIAAEALVLAVRRCLAEIPPTLDAAAETLLEAALADTGAPSGLVLAVVGGARELLCSRGLDEEIAREIQVRWDPCTGPPPETWGRPVVLRVAARRGERLVVLLLDGARRDPTVAARLGAHAQAVRRVLGGQVASRRDSLDPLTSLPDGLALHAIASDAIARAAGEGGPGLALQFVKLDGFAALSDQHGPLACGRLLVEASRLVAHTVRDVDLVARVGAHTLAVLLVGARAGGPARVAERLAAAFARHRFLTREGLDLAVGISLGTVLYPQHGLTARDLFLAAERAILPA